MAASAVAAAEEESEFGGILLLLWTIVPLASFVWKRQMVRGGSWISKLVKLEALKRKQHQRRRLNDMLNDDLLRKQMIKQFQTKLSPAECEAKLQELQSLASQSVTDDDIHVTIENILEAIMWRIWLSFGIWLILLYFGWDDLFYIHIGVVVICIALHEADNWVNFGKFEVVSACCGSKPVLDEEETLLHV